MAWSTAVAIGLMLLVISGIVVARDTGHTGRASETVVNGVSVLTLPPEARTTYRLILHGGPFPSAKDAAVFGNRERLLPRRERGYYREYTVRTPGAHDRGARRIVCGGLPPSRPQKCFYSDDHYASFRSILQ